MTVIYIDVSHHDRERRGEPLDWTAIRAVTSPVMIARATYGDPSGWSRSSPYFSEFQDGAEKAGFTVRGGYHNLIHGDAASISRQVNWLRQILDSRSCNWAMADVEPYAELVTADLWPRWDDVRRFHDVWYSRETRTLAWYIPRWFWSWRDKLASLGEPDLRYLKGPLIQSHYAGGDGTASQIYANAGGDAGTGWGDAYGGRLPDIWQFTSDGNVAGASDRTDVNAFRGTLEDLRALITGGNIMSWGEVIDYPGTEQRNPSGYPAGAILIGTNQAAFNAWGEIKAARAELTALQSVVEQLAKVIEAGGGTVDTAAILRGVDERLAAQRAAIETDTRDAIADAEEGGAAAVRADE